MGAMLKQLWTALTSLFMALEATGNAVHNVAKVGEVTSETWLKSTQIQAEKELKALEAQ